MQGSDVVGFGRKIRLLNKILGRYTLRNNKSCLRVCNLGMWLALAANAESRFQLRQLQLSPQPEKGFAFV